MLKARITRVVGFRCSRLIVALAVVLAGAASANAQEIQTVPGSSCQASGSAQDLSYSGVTVANRGDASASAVCPLARRNPTSGWWVVVVFARDRHSTQNITCVAQARDVNGATGSGWSETLSTSGEGEQVLTFNAPGGPVPDYGPYAVVCSLPAMEEVNQPSYLSSIVIAEP